MVTQHMYTHTHTHTHTHLLYLAWLEMQATRWAKRQVDRVSPRLWISKEMVAIIEVRQFPPVRRNQNCINGKWVKSLLEHSHMRSINTQLCSYICILIASGSSLFRVVHLSGADIKQKSYTVFIDTQSKLTMHIIHAQKDCLFTHNERHTTPFSGLVFKGGTKQRRYTGAGPRGRN